MKRANGFNIDEFLQQRARAVRILEAERKKLRKRLEELDDTLRELGCLPTALARGRPRNSGLTGEAIRFIQRNPGATAAEIASATGVAKGVVGAFIRNGRARREHIDGVFRYFPPKPTHPISGDK